MRKVTREMALLVWKQLESGIDPADTDAPSERTAQRLSDALRRFDLGYPDGQIVKGWEKLVKELRLAFEEYRKTQPKPLIESKTRPSRGGTVSILVPYINRLLDSMWVPHPDEMGEFNPFDRNTGFRIEQVGNRDLAWQQVEGKIVRCWLRVEEEEVLREVLDRLPEPESGRLREFYDSLQNRMMEYLGQVIESQKGGIPHLALLYRLAEETEGLRLLVDQFLRSVRVAVVRSGMP